MIDERCKFCSLAIRWPFNRALFYVDLILLFRTNGLTIAGYNLMLKTYYNIYKQDCQPLYLFLQKASIGLHSENSENVDYYFC